MIFKNKFLLSLFLAFMLAKATTLANIFNNLDPNDFMYSFLIKFKIFFDFLHLQEIKAFNIINLPQGFEGSQHILNFLITYTPIFYLFFLMFNKRFLNFFKEKIQILKLKKSLKQQNKIDRTLTVRLALWCADRAWKRKLKKIEKQKKQKSE